MKNILGIITEYNPFHNGHLLHLEKSIDTFNSDGVVAVMSGNFVQRGLPSLIDKWTKTEMAIQNGVDLVIELPTIYAISSASNFAEGAVKILNSINANNLIFGAETPDINILLSIADILYKEPKEYVSFLKYELSRGTSFPKAREKAVSLYLGNTVQYTNVLTSPNNILGIEYLKALAKFKSKIRPFAIKREFVDYNDKSSNNNYASSTAIREYIENNNLKAIKQVMPENSFNLLLKKLKTGEYVKDLKIFEKEILYKLRTMSLEDLQNTPDVTEGLENAIKLASNTTNNLNTLIESIKSKRYTQTRIQRILLYSLLGITKKDMELSYKTIPYIRVLGFNKKGKKILSNIISQNPKLNVIISVKKFTDTNKNSTLNRFLNIDINATNIYTLGFENNYLANLDYTKKIIDI